MSQADKKIVSSHFKVFDTASERTYGVGRRRRHEATIVIRACCAREKTLVDVAVHVNALIRNHLADRGLCPYEMRRDNGVDSTGVSLATNYQWSWFTPFVPVSVTRTFVRCLTFIRCQSPVQYQFWTSFQFQTSVSLSRIYAYSPSRLALLLVGYASTCLPEAEAVGSHQPCQQFRAAQTGNCA